MKRSPRSSIRCVRGWVGTGPKVHRFETHAFRVRRRRALQLRVVVHSRADPVAAGARRRAWRRGARPRDDVRGLRQRGRARRGHAGAGRRRCRDTGLIDLEQPRQRSPHARGRSCPFTSRAGRWTWTGWTRSPSATAWSVDRGRRARDRRRVARTQDRRIRQLDRVLVLRDEEHLDDRGRRAGHR